MSYFRTTDTESQRLIKTVAEALSQSVDAGPQLNPLRAGAVAQGENYVNGTFVAGSFTQYLLCDIINIDDGVLAP